MSASREKKLRIEEKAKAALNPSGGRKKDSKRFRKIITGVVVGVVLLCIGLYVLSSSALPSGLTAIRVAGVDISAGEFNYHYFSNVTDSVNYYYQIGYLDALGLDITKPLKDQPCYFQDGSWEQYFEEMTFDSLTDVVVQSEEAKKKGITLSGEDWELIDSVVSQMASTAEYYNMTLSKYLTTEYGKGVTEAKLRGYLERMVLSDRYVSSVYDSYVRTDEDLENYYVENKETYDQVDYHTYTFPADLQENAEGETPTDEEWDAYNAAQKALAEEMLAKVTTGDLFWELSKAYEPAGEEPADGEETDGEEADDEPETDPTVHKNILKSNSSLSDTLSAYLFAEESKPGDKTVLDTDGSYTVVLFVSRHRELSNEANVRHLLVKFDDTAEDAEQDKADKLARAEALLAEWKAGAATEESFGALVTEKTDDTASAETGGLYSNININSSYVQPFLDWSTDPARYVGETGIIETSIGYHIMYMSEIVSPYWKIMMKNVMNNTAYSELLTGLKDGVEIKTNWLGMQYTKNR